MRILLHCNGGAATGVGHVMRALALAEEAIAAGHSVTVVGNMDGEFVRRQVDAAGVDLVAVDRDVNAACRRLVQDLHSDVVHVDSYDSDLRPATWLGAAARPLLSNVEDGAFGRRDADLVVGDRGLHRDPRLGHRLIRQSIQRLEHVFKIRATTDRTDVRRHRWTTCQSLSGSRTATRRRPCRPEARAAALPEGPLSFGTSG